MRPIDADTLMKRLEQLETLAMNRTKDTPANIGDRINPAYIRYMTQWDEREAFKELVASIPTAKADPSYICAECRHLEIKTGYHDCWCKATRMKVWLTYYCGFWEKKEDATD